MSDQEKILRSVGIHDGTFHADELSACALLIMFDFIDRDKIFRTRDPSMLTRCEYVCDVGGEYLSEEKLFDHHQSGYRGTLSSAGMILGYIRDEGILSQREYDFFYSMIIRGVDAHDNGKILHEEGVAIFSHVISNFNPPEYDASKDVQEDAFHKAMDFTLGHFQRLWGRYEYVHSCREIVSECMKNSKEIMIFDKALPWQESFFELGGENHPALFVIMPAAEHWKLRGIPPSLDDRMSVRMPLPKEWAGLLDDDLKKVSGILGAVFCHKGLFTSVWETKDAALRALEYIMNKRGGGELWQ